jgi:Protein of unknown function (DUF3617)
MKTHFSFLLFSLTAAGLCAAQPADLPKRKSGLWEVNMQSSARQGASMVTKQCIDEKTDNMMKSWGDSQAQSKCSKQEYKKTAAGYEFESVCKFGESTTTTKGVVTGKLDSGYTMEMNIQSNPPTPGMSNMSIKTSAKLLGACPADMKPGDMEMPGGMRINTQNLAR